MKARDPVQVASRLHDASVSCCAQSKHAKAQRLCLQSLQILKSRLGPKSPDVANVLHTLGTIFQQTNRQPQAEKTFVRSLRIVEKAPRSADVDTLHIMVLDSLAGHYRERGRYQEAEPLYHRAISLAEQTFGSRDGRIAGILNGLAILYKYTARYAEATSLYRRALTIAEKNLGRSDPTV